MLDLVVGVGEKRPSLPPEKWTSESFRGFFSNQEILTFENKMNKPVPIANWSQDKLKGAW